MSRWAICTRLHPYCRSVEGFSSIHTIWSREKGMGVIAR